MAMSSGLINLLRRQFPGVDDPASSANDLLKDVIIQGDQREQLEQDKKLLEEADDTGADGVEDDVPAAARKVLAALHHRRLEHTAPDAPAEACFTTPPPL